METRNTRTTLTNRCGLNLGLSTKFDVALSVDTMAPADQVLHQPHPTQLKRCVGRSHRNRPAAIPIGIARQWSALAVWPTERTVALAMAETAIPVMRESAVGVRSYLSRSKRLDAFGPGHDAIERDRRFEPTRERLIGRREPSWPRS